MSSKIIIALFISAFIFTFGIQPNSIALDDLSSLQCDDGIVAPGDSEDSVKEKCGEPQQELNPDPQEPVKLVYDLGGGSTYYVSIVNGKVERIQVGE
jgi:hypothetical protein